MTPATTKPDLATTADDQPPILTPHGPGPGVIPLQATLRLHQRLDRSELHVLGRRGHWVQINAGGRFVELVHALLIH